MGNIEAEWKMPLTCQALDCNVETQSVYLSQAESTNPMLVMFVDADGCCASYRWEIYGFDLASWELKSSIGGVKTFYSFIPFSDSILYLQSSQPYFGSTQVTLHAFDLTSFSLKGTVSPVLIEYLWNAIGNPANNTVMGCATLPNSRIHFVHINLQTFDVVSAPSEECADNVYFMGAKNPLPTPQPLLATNAGSRNINVTLAMFNDPLVPISQQTISNQYPTNVITDGANAFVFTRLWSDQSISQAYQYSYSNGKLVPLGMMVVPAGFIVFEMQWPTVSYSASYSLQQLAVPLTSASSASSQAILVLDYNDKPV